MKRYGLVLAIGLVLVINAIVFVGVAYNRSGIPDATLTLTEREISIALMKKENSGLFLQLNWEMSGAYQFNKHISSPNWLNKSKLQELGFQIPILTNDIDAGKYYGYYGKTHPRKTFIALEYEGKSWHSWLKDNQKDLENISGNIKSEKDALKKKNLEKSLKQRARLPLVKSRLFAIDAGNDPARLRQVYSDRNRYIITRGVIKVNYIPGKHRKNSKKHEPAHLQGRIQRLFPLEIFVPNSFRNIFNAIKSPHRYTYYYVPLDKIDSELMPQYEVTLKFGKKYEAWISDVKSLKQTL